MKYLYNLIEPVKPENREIAFVFFHYFHGDIVRNVCHILESLDTDKKETPVTESKVSKDRNFFEFSEY